MPTTNADVELFKTVSELLKQQDVDSSSERRIDPRRPYQCVQLLAQYDGEKLPTQAEFRQVQCQDLSEHGFSFSSHRRPQTQWVVVALGAIPFLFYVAEIVNIKPVDAHPDNEFRIGCRFTRRLARPTSA